MSVLMTLKYPISTPPTREQLDALPQIVFDKWAIKLKFSSGDPLTPHTVFYVFNTLYNDGMFSEKNAKQMRLFIKKLNEIIYNLDEVE